MRKFLSLVSLLRRARGTLRWKSVFLEMMFSFAR